MEHRQSFNPDHGTFFLMDITIGFLFGFHSLMSEFHPMMLSIFGSGLVAMLMSMASFVGRKLIGYIWVWTLVKYRQLKNRKK